MSDESGDTIVGMAGAFHRLGQLAEVLLSLWYSCCFAAILSAVSGSALRLEFGMGVEKREYDRHGWSSHDKHYRAVITGELAFWFGVACL
jgi:integral membrane sensor domain MASE1